MSLDVIQRTQSISTPPVSRGRLLHNRPIDYIGKGKFSGQQGHY